MHTADPNSLLGHICQEVASLKPGQSICVDINTLRDIPSFQHKGAIFRPADRVLGNIIGSAYTHSFTENTTNGTVTFHRHEETGRRYYEDPDRRNKTDD